MGLLQSNIDTFSHKERDRERVDISKRPPNNSTDPKNTNSFKHKEEKNKKSKKRREWIEHHRFIEGIKFTVKIGAENGSH